MGLSSWDGKMSNIEQSGVCGSDDGAARELDVDAVIGGTTIDAVAVNFEEVTTVVQPESRKAALLGARE